MAYNDKKAALKWGLKQDERNFRPIVFKAEKVRAYSEVTVASWEEISKRFEAEAARMQAEHQHRFDQERAAQARREAEAAEREKIRLAKESAERRQRAIEDAKALEQTEIDNLGKF